MKKLFSHLRTPLFWQDTHLRTITLASFLLDVISVIVAFMIAPLLAIILLLLLITIFGVSVYVMETIMQRTHDYVSDLSYRAKVGEQEAVIQMPVGVIIYNKDYRIQWVNPFIQHIIGDDNIINKKINELDQQFSTIVLTKDTTVHNIHWHNNDFQVTVQPSINAMYFIETTKYMQLQRHYQEEQIVIGQLFLDNYDEVTQTMDDQTVSNLSNYVTNLLSDWANEFHLFLKRVDDDHFFLMGYMRALKLLEKDKFTILDTIREATSKQNYPLTLSVGIAYGDHNLAQLANDSQSYLDLALGRGGDQVVVKNSGEPARFYGGQTNPMEKRTRVRARMISQAMQDLFKQADQIFVMGHNHPDMDSLGASLGIRRIAQMNNKKCWVVVNPDTLHTDVQRLLKEVQEYPQDEESIITPVDAIDRVTVNSLLIMVDHSKPSISISPELYNKLTNRTIVIDHHRRGEEFPKNPMLVYIEPYASSTCELVTEMFEYQPKNAEAINKIEATAMLAGITVDTHSFSLRTGTRTFDAASYLRSVGANAIMVQKLLKENINNYLEKNHLVDTVEMVMPNVALCMGANDEPYDPVIAAQAADTLLSLSGIDASYVIIRRNDGKVGVSARSLGDINVQIVMEEMGGGGHLSNAATQIEGKSVMEVHDELLAIILHQNDDDSDDENDDEE